MTVKIKGYLPMKIVTDFCNRDCKRIHEMISSRNRETPDILEIHSYWFCLTLEYEDFKKAYKKITDTFVAQCRIPGYKCQKVEFEHNLDDKDCSIFTEAGRFKGTLIKLNSDRKKE